MPREHHTMWLPGFGPVAAEPVALPVPQKPLAIEVKEYIQEKTREVWPASRADLWDRSFTPVERFTYNLAAVKAARSLKAGEKPDTATREALNLFTGWGALSSLFGHEPAWAARRQLLEATQQEAVESARKAVTTSFFTPPAIGRAIWTGLRRLGFKGGKVLEPSVGSGLFLETMPEDIARGSQITAVDLDSTAATIVSALYQPYGVKVINAGFEKAPLPADFFDLCITNVPFGDFHVPDTRSVPYRNWLIHDWFLAKSLEVVRPGGLVVAITSSGTMDKVNAVARTYLHTQAELVAAFRLPTTAFKAFAGTEPTSDILIFRRYKDGESRQRTDEASWIDTAQVRHGHSALGGNSMPVAHGLPMNEWFHKNPSNILGKMAAGNLGGYRTGLVCESDGTDFLATLMGKMETLPEGVYKRFAARREKPQVVREVLANENGLVPGSFVVAEGKLAVSEGHELVVIEETTPATTKARILGMIQLRTEVKALIAAQMESADDANPSRLRAQLNKTYDQFVSVHGPLTNNANTRAFSGDPAAPLLHSLESVLEDGTVEKADVFHRRTIGAVVPVTHCDTPEDALLVSLAEVGRVDPALMARLTKCAVEDVVDDLACKGAIFMNPTHYAWETADEYLSGDVKTKLAMAELAGEDFTRNVSALKEVIPADLAPTDIAARIGSTWIPLSDYRDFLAEVFGCDTSTSVSYEALTGSWDVKRSHHHLSVAVTQTFGTSRVDPLTLFEMAANQQVPTLSDADPTDKKKRVVNQKDTIAAREKQQEIKDRFVEWLWSDDARALRLAGCYNDTFNRTVDRKFDGKHLVLPGLSNHYTLDSHQRDAVWRVVSSKRNTLLAHCVGAGKTLEMVCSAMELKRLGVATKPAIVVPNHMLLQVASEVVTAYPSANVLMVTKDDLAATNRRRFLARVATNNWDMVVITHSSFERIKMSEEVVSDYIESQIDLLSSAVLTEKASGNRATVKQLERYKRDWEARLEKLAASKLDEGLDLTFEELGVDWLMVDEAHCFKSLYRFSKMSRVAGLPTSNSERAFDMYLKVRYLTSLHEDRGGVTFATATPVMNSIGEIHVMQRFLQSDTLTRNGIAMFDAWAANFGEAVSAIELAPDGSGYRMNTRFARFTNVPELMRLFREVADIRTAEMLNLPRPDFVRETVTAKPSELLKEFVQTLVKRSEAIKNGRVKPGEDNMLAITGDGRKAALDMRMINPKLPDDPGTKINLCVEKVWEIYQETAAERLTQVLFLDMGTPGSSKSFDAYSDIKQKLVARGVPAHEVAFAHDATSDEAKARLAKDVRKGKVRVIIGSTQKLGVGTNIQDRLIALHHLDGPWRPGDIEQREGRIVRRGNVNKCVRIYRYVTEGSFDAYVWQTLETKARFIAQIMMGDSGIRSAEDLELAALSYAEVKALASGNPLVLEKAGIDAEVARLCIMKSEFDNQQWANKRELASLPDWIDKLQKSIAANDVDAQALSQIQTIALNVGNQVLTDRGDIGKAIQLTVEGNLFQGAKEVIVGQIGGFTLTVRPSFAKDQYKLRLRGRNFYEQDFTGKAVSAANTLDSLFAELRTSGSYAQRNLVELERRAEGLRQQLGASFDKADRLAHLLERQQEVNAQLGICDGVMVALEAA